MLFWARGHLPSCVPTASGLPPTSFPWEGRDILSITECLELPIRSISVCPALPGEVTTLQTLDRERQSSYQLLVQVQDGGSPPRSVTGTIHVAVLDLNDNSPTFLQASGAAGGGLPVQVCEAAVLCPEEVRGCVGLRLEL